MVPNEPAQKTAAKKEKVVVQEGIFAPAVKLTAQVMGRKELNAFRASVIAEHTKVISAFVDTSESAFGQIALKQMFEAACVHGIRMAPLTRVSAPSLADARDPRLASPPRRDKDGNGTLDKEEVKAALYALGFKFIEDKDVDKIFKRADSDKNGASQAHRSPRTRGTRPAARCG